MFTGVLLCVLSEMMMMLSETVDWLSEMMMMLSETVDWLCLLVCCCVCCQK